MNNHTKICMCQVEEMIEYAWKQALKYRFDPVAGRIHEEYLSMIKNLKDKHERNSL